MSTPAPSQFDAKEAPSPASDITVIKLSGQLDAHTAPEFERFLEQRVREEKKSKLILDFSDLEYISSAGLGVLMGLIEEVRSQSGDMKLIGVPEKIYHVLDLLGFPDPGRPEGCGGRTGIAGALTATRTCMRARVSRGHGRARAPPRRSVPYLSLEERGVPC